MNDKTTILELLKAGCTIKFPSGYSFVGDPVDKYIELRTEFGSDGLETLTEEGVQKALWDEEKYRKDLEETEG